MLFIGGRTQFAPTVLRFLAPTRRGNLWSSVLQCGGSKPPPYRIRLLFGDIPYHPNCRDFHPRLSAHFKSLSHRERLLKLHAYTQKRNYQQCKNVFSRNFFRSNKQKTFNNTARKSAFYQIFSPQDRLF